MWSPRPLHRSSLIPPGLLWWVRRGRADQPVFARVPRIAAGELPCLGGRLCSPVAGDRPADGSDRRNGRSCSPDRRRDPVFAVRRTANSCCLTEFTACHRLGACDGPGAQKPEALVAASAAFCADPFCWRRPALVMYLGGRFAVGLTRRSGSTAHFSLRGPRTPAARITHRHLSETWRGQPERQKMMTRAAIRGRIGEVEMRRQPPDIWRLSPVEMICRTAADPWWLPRAEFDRQWWRSSGARCPIAMVFAHVPERCHQTHRSRTAFAPV